MTRTNARAEYARIRAAYIARSPEHNTVERFNGQVRLRACRMADCRLSAKYRFYNGADRALKAKEEGRDYPDESLPTQEEWLVAATRFLRHFDRTVY